MKGQLLRRVMLSTVAATAIMVLGSSLALAGGGFRQDGLEVQFKTGRDQAELRLRNNTGGTVTVTGLSLYRSHQGEWDNVTPGWVADCMGPVANTKELKCRGEADVDGGNKNLAVVDLLMADGSTTHLELNP